MKQNLSVHAYYQKSEGVALLVGTVIQHNEQAARQGHKEPSSPDLPAVSARPGDDLPGNGCHGGTSK
jgi:hypothetical protein